MPQPDLTNLPDLPVAALVPALAAALAAGRRVVLQAEPGAGKTTLLPPALLGETWLAGQSILVLEPRRLAARAAATRIAELLGEEAGETAGYRVRREQRVGPRTRIEVLTEGILPRRLQADPGLAGVGLVVFDEFHERSLDADLGLALVLESAAALRPDLRLLVLSATIDTASVASLLGDALVLASPGRLHPVETRYLDLPANRDPAVRAAAAVRSALRGTTGDVLVFLPGAPEIRRAAEALARDPGPAPVAVVPLHGSLPWDEQKRALAPATGGPRRVVLASAIAETSLTIDGVGVVVDAGLSRRPAYDPASGLSRLVTGPVSRAAADQRRGRAGRLGPGTCYRLWTPGAERDHPAFDEPEILQADLAGLVLQLAAWGTSDPGTLAWLDPPPAAAWSRAAALLADLGALDAAGRITAHGKRMAALPAHPRLAHLLLAGAARGALPLAARLAALLGERDILRFDGEGQADIELRLAALEAVARGADGDAPGRRLDRGAARRVLDEAGALERECGATAGRDKTAAGPVSAGLLLAAAWPDRVGARRDAAAPGAGPGSARYALSGGRAAALPPRDPLGEASFLAAAEVDGGDEGRIRLAAAVTPAELETLFAERITIEEELAADGPQGRLVCRRRRKLGRIALEERTGETPSPDAARAFLLAELRRRGLGLLVFDERVRGFLGRSVFLARAAGDLAAWPASGDEALLADLETWLGPWLDGCAALADLARIDLVRALGSRLPPGAGRLLDELAPTRLTLASGTELRVGYGTGEGPVAEVRLQALFGTDNTPTVCRGRVPVVLEILSPAGRPLQRTADLGGFWRGSYGEVRKEMRGRYPKHPWPEEPWACLPPAKGRRNP